MPTPAGWGVLAASVAVTALGRTFATPILFVLAAAMISSVVIAVIDVALRRPRLTARRHVDPAMTSVGADAEVVVTIDDHRLIPSRSLRVAESVVLTGGQRVERWFGLDRTTRADTARRHRVSSPIDTGRRGVLVYEPLLAESTDLLGLARRRVVFTDTDEIVIAPRTIEVGLPMVEGDDLGRRSRTIRPGIGEFAGLRAYRPGDEPRRIHWPASARTGGLKVREYATEDVRRCTIVLDTSPPGSPVTEAADSLELAVSVAASLVEAADGCGLLVRLVTSDGHDLRGIGVTAAARPVLARIGETAPLTRIRRDPHDGRGLIIAIGRTAVGAARLARDIGADLTVATDGVDVEERSPGRQRLIRVGSLEAFASAWGRINRSVVRR